MTMIGEIFYDIPVERLDVLIAFEGKAKSVYRRSEGFSGQIVFLDNGENVKPRYITAKYPKYRSDRSPAKRAKWFLQELELQASAHYHPNVHWPFHTCMIMKVPVAYFRRWEGDLSSYIEDNSFGDIGRISLIIQLIDGLLHCNARGLVHQDLKPENIFVRNLRESFVFPGDDLWLRPMVADFGSVNLASKIGEHRGSRPYMAPEQWEKKPHGEWTNVFAIGIILHELISRGAHPIGEHGGDWHREKNPGFNRFQDSKRWRKWVEKACPIAQPLTNKNLAGIVADCLTLCPSKRPSLIDVQQRLLVELNTQSPIAYTQAELDLYEAKRLTSKKGEWEELNDRLNLLKCAIEADYPDEG